MGTTYGSINVLSDEPISVDPYSFASWSPGWQTLVPTYENRELLTDPEGSAKAARKLSGTLDKTVLWFFLFDESETLFKLFSGGRVAASFSGDYAPGKGLSLVPGLVGLEESYRKRLAKILACGDPEIQLPLLEEYFGVKLVLFPEMLEDDPQCAVRSRGDALFRQFIAESAAPTGKKAPVQLRLVQELSGILEDCDFHEKYGRVDGRFRYFRKHYWLYAEAGYTGAPETPICFRNGKLEFISDEELLRDGVDPSRPQTCPADPLFRNEYLPGRIVFAPDAPAPYAGKTVRLPRGFYGLGFDTKDRMLLACDGHTVAVMDGEGKLIAKQNVKGHAIDQDGDYILTFEEKWADMDVGGRMLPVLPCNRFRVYELYDRQSSAERA